MGRVIGIQRVAELYTKIRPVPIVIFDHAQIRKTYRSAAAAVYVGSVYVPKTPLMRDRTVYYVQIQTRDVLPEDRTTIDRWNDWGQSATAQSSWREHCWRHALAIAAAHELPIEYDDLAFDQFSEIDQKS